MADMWQCQDCGWVWCLAGVPWQDSICDACGGMMLPSLTPSADLPACRDEDPAHAATLAACYPPEYQHSEDDDG